MVYAFYEVEKELILDRNDAERATYSSFQVDRAKYYWNLYGTETPSLAQKISLWTTNVGFQCVATYRLGQFSKRLYNKSKLIGLAPLIAHIFFHNVAKIIHHVYISKEAEIGPGFFLMHYYSIHIGGGVKIGKNCTIHHHLTIGERVARLDHGVAEVGDNVWIGPNVVLSGSIKIGRGSTISAGCILSRDIPERSLAAGNPGRVIMNDYDNSKMINYRCD